MPVESGLVHRECVPELDVTFEAPEREKCVAPCWENHHIPIWGEPRGDPNEGYSWQYVQSDEDHWVGRFSFSRTGTWTITIPYMYTLECVRGTVWPWELCYQKHFQFDLTLSVTINVAKDGNREWQCESQTGSCACAQGTEDCCQEYGAATG